MSLKAKLLHLLEMMANGALEALFSLLVAAVLGWRKWIRARLAARALTAVTEDKMALETNLIEKTEVKSKLALINGKIAVVTAYEGKLGGVDLTAYIKGDALVDFIEGVIPGDWDKIPAALIKEKLRTL